MSLFQQPSAISAHRESRKTESNHFFHASNSAENQTALSLQRQNLTSLPTNIGSTIVSLDLSYNYITWQSNESLTPLCNIITLNLSSNRITQIHDLSCLSNLQSLNLSHNLIEKPAIQNIQRNKNLRHLDLSFNKILTKPAVEKLLPFLTSIDIQGNPLRTNVSPLQHNHSTRAPRESSAQPNQHISNTYHNFRPPTPRTHAIQTILLQDLDTYFNSLEESNKRDVHDAPVEEITSQCTNKACCSRISQLELEISQTRRELVSPTLIKEEDLFYLLSNSLAESEKLAAIITQATSSFSEAAATLLRNLSLSNRSNSSQMEFLNGIIRHQAKSIESILSNALIHEKKHTELLTFIHEKTLPQMKLTAKSDMCCQTEPSLSSPSPLLFFSSPKKSLKPEQLTHNLYTFSQRFSSFMKKKSSSRLSNEKSTGSPLSPPSIQPLESNETTRHGLLCPSPPTIVKPFDVSPFTVEDNSQILSQLAIPNETLLPTSAQSKRQPSVTPSSNKQASQTSQPQLRSKPNVQLSFTTMDLLQYKKPIVKSIKTESSTPRTVPIKLHPNISPANSSNSCRSTVTAAAAAAGKENSQLYFNSQRSLLQVQIKKEVSKRQSQILQQSTSSFHNIKNQSLNQSSSRSTPRLL